MSKSENKLKEVLKSIHKKYGEGSLINYGATEREHTVPTISTGLASLDLILGGGMPKGRIMEVYGPESSGKTTLSLHMLAKCQKDDPNKTVAFIDIENALDPSYAQNLGVDLAEDKFYLSQPDSGEEALDIVEKLCQSNAVSAIVIDSVAQLVPMAVGAKEIDGTANIATTARLLSQTIPRISNAAARSGTVLIFINQIRMNVGAYGNPEISPGGKALKFASSVRLEIRGGKPEERNGKEGTVVRVLVKKNKIARPFRRAELWLIYGEGFDAIENMLESALAIGIIERGGAWYTYGDIKEQGWQNIVAKLREDELILNEIQKKLEEIKI